MADITDNFLGKGWATPLGTDATAEIALAAYQEDVRQAIRIILGTVPGERVMRPEFGAGLQSLVFEPLSTTTVALAQHRVQEALVTWEPRIDVQNVTASLNDQRNTLLLEIAYRIRATNTFYNLVYPFYLLESQLS
jgi:phage baseplate assembly protein W